jgi:hypothetical protein
VQGIRATETKHGSGQGDLEELRGRVREELWLRSAINHTRKNTASQRRNKHALTRPSELSSFSNEEGSLVKLLCAIAFALIPFAGPAQSLDSSLLAALCADDYFEDSAGQCSTIHAHEITIESILEKYGVIIIRDTDDEIAIFHPSDPDDVPVSSIRPRNEGAAVDYSILTDDESTGDATIVESAASTQIMATEATLERHDETIREADEVAITGPNGAKNVADGAIERGDENRTVE